MRDIDLSNALWRKSTYSDGDGGNCVEVLDHVPGIVPVRDSKVAAGPTLIVSRASWATFVAGVTG